MKLIPLAPDSDTELLKFNAREVATLARAIVLVEALEALRYPGSGDVLAWLRQLQETVTP